MSTTKTNPNLVAVETALDAFCCAFNTYMLRNDAWLSNPNRYRDSATSIHASTDDAIAAWASIKQAMRKAISGRSFGYRTVRLTQSGGPYTRHASHLKPPAKKETP